MISLAEVAPAAPVAGPALIALGACISFIVLWGLDKFWRATLGPLFERIGNTGFGGIHRIGAVKPLHFLVTASDAVERWIKQGEAASERAIVWGFGTLLWAFYNLTFTIVKAVYDLNTAIDNVWHEATTGTAKVIRQTIVRPVERTVVRGKAASDARIRGIEAEIAHLTARLAHVAKATAGAFASPFPRIGHLERDVSTANKWLRKHRYLAAYTSLAALGLAMLKRLGLGWLRCGNVNKAGKAVCGMNPLALEALLLAALPLAVDFNLREFVGEMQTVVEDGAKLIQKLAE